MDETRRRRGPEDDEARRRRLEEHRQTTIAFRLPPDLQDALEQYLEEHPKETKTNLLVFLLRAELARLGYASPIPKRDPDSPGLFDKVGPVLPDELDRLALELRRAADRLRRE